MNILIMVMMFLSNVISNVFSFIGGLPSEILGGAVALVVGYILKLIPNEKLAVTFEKLMYGLGVAVTLGISRIKIQWIKTLWQKTIEAYIVDALNNIVVHGLQGFIKGLRSDNE